VKTSHCHHYIIGNGYTTDTPVDLEIWKLIHDTPPVTQSVTHKWVH